MPNITVTQVDSAGGTIQGGGQSFVRFNGNPIAVLGDAVAGHGKSPHSGPTMAQGSSFFKINGIPVCFQGNVATCGHSASGQAGMNISN